MPGQKQHVDIQRKLKLRTSLIEKAGKLQGAYYIPFIGEGDIAAELYTGKKIFGADTNVEMLHKAIDRLPGAEIITADCDQFPFNKKTATFGLADFDAYSYPYDSFRSFWKEAKIASQCVLIFTDGQRQAVIHTGSYRTPDGEKHKLTKLTDKREAYNFYYKTVFQWFVEYIKPWKVVWATKYLRNGSMCYWGAIIQRPANQANHSTHTNNEGDETAKGDIKSYKCDDIKKASYLEHISNGHTRGYAATLVGLSRMTVSRHMKAGKGFAEAISEAESDAIAKMENALFEAGVSGNVTAIQVFLYNRDPKRWSDKRNIQLAGEGGGPIEVNIGVKDLSDEELLDIINRRRSRGVSGKKESKK